ncbi:MAG: polyribonucleotide nucleotidyltransferase [Patescibacteria group bacterium]|nr:polyribonucleotide nucleotidyltransferase [Patescibacteria group bacterium]
MTKKFKLEIGKRDLVAEVKNLADQSNGSIFVQYGDTLVLATVVMSGYQKKAFNFFPLTVNYEERFYAAGKIKGARYIRRETRPSDEAIGNARLIDRVIRPLFPENLNREVQVVVTVLSWDGQNEPDVVGLFASSLALSISDVPWNGPTAAVRVGRIDNKFVLNPTYEEIEKSDIDIVFAGVKKQDGVLINMIEGGFNEVDEESVLKAYEFSKVHLEKLIDFEQEISKEIGKEKVDPVIPEVDPELDKEIKEFLGNKLEKAFFQKGKSKNDLNQLRDELMVFVQEKYPEKIGYADKFFEGETKRLMHKNILEKERRSDGRKLNEIRNIDSQVGILPRTHGSGVFIRGQTKSLSILTLGAPGDVQLVEGMEIVGKKRFMHHYNFPPYSVGEVRPLRAPNRREIGHGLLAEKALLPLIPSPEEFPYTIRIVSEILSSNGSSSMAAVSSSCLALMDAGVPIKSPVTGIALGLIMKKGANLSTASSSKGDYKILTDIQGPEDHHGEMDFKVAGTKKGITVIQMDIKIDGISERILKESLEEAKRARLQILEKISETLKEPRPNLSPFAPRILTVQINPDKIRKVIGPGGKTINEITEETGASIDIEDTGRIFITAEKEEGAKKAMDWVKSLTREVKRGEVFQGKVTRILDFGAFVEILPGQEGLLHISKLSKERVRSVKDVLSIGDSVLVIVIGIDEQGRIDLALDKYKKEHVGRR